MRRTEFGARISVSAKICTHRVYRPSPFSSWAFEEDFVFSVLEQFFLFLNCRFSPSQAKASCLLSLYSWISDIEKHFRSFLSHYWLRPLLFLILATDLKIQFLNSFLGFIFGSIGADISHSPLPTCWATKQEFEFSTYFQVIAGRSHLTDLVTVLSEA